MNRKMLAVGAVVGVIMLGTAGLAGAQEFLADMVSREGKETVTAKIVVAGDKIRMEMPESTMIIRRDKDLTWMLMPAEKTYMEQPINMAQAPKATREFDNEISREPLGTETVDGQPAEKFKVTYKEKNKNVSVYQWLRAGEFPVKVEALDGSWSTEFKNLKTGAQPAGIFEPPADYEKFAMPNLSDMMKAFGGM